MSDVRNRVAFNERSMHNALPSAKELAAHDHCCGIHGAARERKGIKHATSCARRRSDKALIAEEV